MTELNLTVLINITNITNNSINGSNNNTQLSSTTSSSDGSSSSGWSIFRFPKKNEPEFYGVWELFGPLISAGLIFASLCIAIMGLTIWVRQKREQRASQRHRQTQQDVQSEGNGTGRLIAPVLPMLDESTRNAPPAVTTATLGRQQQPSTSLTLPKPTSTAGLRKKSSTISEVDIDALQNELESVRAIYEPAAGVITDSSQDNGDSSSQQCSDHENNEDENNGSKTVTLVEAVAINESENNGGSHNGSNNNITEFHCDNDQAVSRQPNDVVTPQSS